MLVRIWLVAALASACSYPYPGDGFRLELVSEPAVTTTVGTQVAEPLVVAAVDPDGNPLDNLTLEVTVTGGSVPASTLRTDLQGRVQTTFVASTVAGDNTVTFDTVDLDAEPVSITVTGTPDVPAMVEPVAGTGQMDVVDRVLPEPLVVEVRDQYANAVPNAPVELVVTGGNGAVIDAPVTAGPDGRASTMFRLGRAAGENLVEARSAGATTAELRATGLPDVAAQLVKPAAGASGDNQSALVGTVLPSPIVAKVADQFGNGVAGVTVQFQAALGGGSVSPASAVSDALGEVATQHTLGPSVGTNRVEVRSTNLANSPLVYNAAAIAGNPTSIQVVSGNQTATVNTTPTTPLVVRVSDASNQPVEGVLVTFATTTNGAPVTPVVATNAQGRAETRYRLSTVSGPNLVNATVNALAPATFTVTGTPDVPIKLVAQPVPALVSAGIAVAVTAVAADQFDNPVPGVTGIGFQLTNGQAQIVAPSSTTDTNGLVTAQITPSQMSNVTITASKSGLTSATFVLDVREFLQTLSVGGAINGLELLRELDVNRDGKPDLLFHDGDNLRVILNTTTTPGSMTFAAPFTIPSTGNQISSVSIGDLDGNQTPDLLVASSGTGCSNTCVRAMVNNTMTTGPITFVASAPLSGVGGGQSLRRAFASDVNSDGRPDIVGIDSTNQLYVYFNSGNPNLTTPIEVENFSDSVSASADLNADGRADVFSSNGDVGRNTTDFQSMTTPRYASDNAPSGIVLDLVGDGKPDAASAQGGSITVHRNDSTAGNINFTEVFAMSGDGTRPAVGDIDGDGKRDIVLLDTGFAVCLNRSVNQAISFTDATQFSVSGAVQHAVADFNGDGRADVAVGTSVSIQIFLAQ
jgi:hypothetical protein